MKFVEVYVRSAIVIPIAAWVVGIDWVLENGRIWEWLVQQCLTSSAMGRPPLGFIAGVCWFGLRFLQKSPLPLQWVHLGWDL